MKSLERTYLIVGTDALKRDEALRRLKARLEPSLAPFNLHECTSSDITATELIASLNTLPVGDSIRIIIVREADHLLKETSEALITYLKDPCTSSVLVLVADTLARNTRLYKAVSAAGSRTVIDCTPKKRWELPAQVKKMAAARGITIDEAATQELVARVGESTTLLDAQLSILAEIYAQSGHIRLEDVETSITRIAEVKPWYLLDAICARNASKALSLYAIMHNTSQVALIAMLATRVRELICAKSLEQRGQASMVAKELHKQAWQIKNHLRWARGFDTGELETLLCRCVECDAAIKGGGDPDTIFTDLIVIACNG